MLGLVSKWLWYVCDSKSKWWKSESFHIFHGCLYLVVWFIWLLNHLIYFNLRKKFCSFKQFLQIHKMKTIFIQNGRLFSKKSILSEDSCHFLNLLSSRDLSQAEKNNTFLQSGQVAKLNSQVLAWSWQVTKKQQQKKGISAWDKSHNSKSTEAD